MSCHDIGHGMNMVASKVYYYYAKGEIPFDVAKDLIYHCMYGVNYCDGNEYEAVEFMEDEGICPCCLERKNESDLLFYDEFPENLKYMEDIIRPFLYSPKVPGYFICKSCAEKIYQEKVKTDD